MDEINWTNKIFAQNSSFNHIRQSGFPSWINGREEVGESSRLPDGNADVTLQVA
jgi:hypothetical protein